MNYATSLKHDRLQKVIDRIDGASGPGVLIIGTTGMGTELAHVTLAKPSFGPPAGGQISLLGTPLIDAAAAATGVPAVAIITDSDGVAWVSGLTVGVDGSGADIIVSQPVVNTGDEFKVDGGTIIHA